MLTIVWKRCTRDTHREEDIVVVVIKLCFVRKTTHTSVMRALALYGLVGCHVLSLVSLALFVHALHASSSSLVAISLAARDYPNRTFDTSVCPERCTCASIQSRLSGEVLRTTDCSNLSLAVVPRPLPADTEALVLVDNALDSLALDGLDQLQELDVSRNRITHLGRGHVFANLSRLRVLHMSRNAFRTLFAAAFRGLRRLHSLVMADGQLKHLDEHSFDGLESLSELNLANNQLAAIYLELFQSISNLRSLNLSGNRLTHLSGGVLASMSTLEELDVSHNSLSALNDNAFVGLSQLRTLRLDHNALPRVPALALQSLRRVLSVTLDGNAFRQLSTGDFVHFGHAQSISVTRCPQLSLVDRGAFWDIPALVRLELHSNPALQFVDPQALLGCPALRHLLLHDCALKTFAPEMAAHLPRRTSVTLTGNALLCDCNVRFLHQCLAAGDNCSLSVPNGERLLCGEPMRGRPLLALNDSDIADECAPQLVAVSAPITHRKVGDRQQFECRAVGRPPPRVHWRLPSGEVLNETSNAVHVQLRPTGSLRLFHLKPKDSGDYECVAENALGRRAATMRLEVDALDLHLYAVSVGATYATLVWNGTSRNSFREYELEYNSTDNSSDSVVVNHFLRAHTIAPLRPQTAYRVCLCVRDADAVVQLVCTALTTRAAAHFGLKQTRARRSNVGAALVVTAALLVAVCAVLCAKRFGTRRRDAYTRATEKTTTERPIVLESICRPLMTANVNRFYD